MSRPSVDATVKTVRSSRFVFTPDQFHTLTNLIEKRCGLTFSQFKKREFQLKLDKLDSNFVNNTDDLIEAVTLSDEALQKIINVLTVGESYFFRNRPHFNALRYHIIPDLIDTALPDHSLNIWCAGSARGEEPYSLAMLLHDRFPQLKEWDVSITATDINTDFLAEARKAIYRQWAFRGVDPSIVKRFFHRDINDDLRLHENIKKAVRFKHFNLMELLQGAQPMQGNLDLISCRNVLIYFPFEVADQIVNAFLRLLRPGGFLLVGHSEAFPALGNFEVIYSNATYYYRKHSDLATAQLSMPAAATAAIPGIAVRTTMAPPPHDISLVTKKNIEKLKPSITPPPPKAAVTILDQARQMADSGKIPEALKVLQSHAESEGRLDHRVHFILALLADHSGDIAQAVESLKRSIFLQKNFVIGHYYLGVVYQREGDLGTARRHFKNVMRLLQMIPDSALIEESEGLNAGRLKEIVNARFEEIDLEQPMKT